MLISPPSCVDFLYCICAPMSPFPSYILHPTRRSSQFMAQEYDIPSAYLFDYSDHRSFLFAVLLGFFFSGSVSFSHAHIVCLCIFYYYRPYSLYIQIVRVLGNRIPAVLSLWDNGPLVSERPSSHTACIKVVGSVAMS